MRVHCVLYAGVFIGLCTGQIEVLNAQTPIPSRECSSLVENREPCKSTVTTFAGASGSSSTPPATAVSAQASNSPPAIRVAPKVTVTVVIHKRPLESVQSQLTCNQPPKPDVIGTILAKLGPPLGGLTVWNRVFGLDRVRPKGLVEDFKARLDDIATDQEDTLKQINAQNGILTDVTREISAAQKYAPALSPDGRWQGDDVVKFRNCLTHITTRVTGFTRVDGQSVNTAPLESCETLDSADAKKERGKGVQALPSAHVAALTKTVSDLPKDLGALQDKLPKPQSPVEIKERNELIKDLDGKINQLTDRQDVLSGALKSVQANRATVVSYAQTLDDWNESWPKDPDRLVTQSFSIFCDSSKSGQATGSAKLTTQSLLTKETGDGGTVAVTWVHQPWEVSAGIMWSTVLGHSFQNTPVLSAGVPVVDSKGNKVTAVTDSTTKPTIDALVLVHWRFYERPTPMQRRFAILGSVGVGTGTNGSGADFALGPSFAFGNFFLSPLLHFTRDLRLTKGVTLGQNLGGTSPPTERFWVHKFGLVFTYAVPIT